MSFIAVRMRPTGRGTFVALVILALLLMAPTLASATDEEDVERAEAARQAAYDRLVEVNSELDVAIADYQAINVELEELEYRIDVILSRISDHESQLVTLRERAKDLVTQAYVSSGTNVFEIAFEADSIQDLLTSQVLIDRAADRDLEALDRLDALTREMDRLREQVVADQAHVQDLSDDASAAVDRLDELQAERSEEYERRDEAAREARVQYEEEQRRRKLEEAAKARGAAGGVGVISGFVCPVQGGASFINDWGFPRSGGRSHQGTDMFAARGTPVVAVGNGTVSLRSNTLGGTSAYVRTSSALYYYAHLDGYPAGLSSGDSVTKGTVVGYVGNTGNAVGSSPHLHFEIHPGGGSAVNPFPTVSQVC